MKKYEFRFKNILHVRELLEEQAEREFRDAVLAYNAELEKLENLRAEAERLIAELFERRRGRIDVGVEMVFATYFTNLRERTEAQVVAVHEAEQFMEQKRAELIEAMKERKVMEKLRLRDYDAWLLELKRWEQAMIDDLSTLRHGNAQVAELRPAQS